MTEHRLSTYTYIISTENNAHATQKPLQESIIIQSWTIKFILHTPGSTPENFTTNMSDMLHIAFFRLITEK